MTHPLPKRQKFVILANFPPAFGEGAAHAGDLACLLDESGAEVVTASEPGFSFARIPLIYRSKRDIAETRLRFFAEVNCQTPVIIYANGLDTRNIDQTTWRYRRWEEWRRFRLAYDAARQAKSCTIVFTGAQIFSIPFWLSLGLLGAVFLTRPHGIKAFNNRSVGEVFHHLTGNTASSLPKKVSDCLFRLAKTRDENASSVCEFIAKLRLALVKRKDSAPVLMADIDEIQQVAMLQTLSGKAFIPANVGFQFGIAGAQDSMQEFANEIVQDGLSRLELHRRHLQHERGNTPRAKQNDPKQFLYQYTHLHQNTGEPMPSEFGDCDQFPLLPAELVALAKRDTYGSFDFDCPSHRMTFALELILRFSAQSHSADFLPQNALTYLARPIGGEHGNLSKMELLCGIRAGLLDAEEPTMQTPWSSQEIRDWFATALCATTPTLNMFSTGTQIREPAMPAIQITGIIEGSSGLAQNAWMSAAAFKRLGLPVLMRDKSDMSVAQPLPADGPAPMLHRSLILHHINAEALPAQILAQGFHDGTNPLHIGYMLWELEAVPKSHLLAGELLNDIWVPSVFVQKIYEKSFGREITNIGKGISLPDVAPADLRRYGLNDSHLIFLNIFDAASSVERKNPVAAALAFLEAFPTDPRARLIIKTTPVPDSAWGDPNGQMKTLRELAHKDPRIVIITEHLPFRALLQLIKRCDCIVSTHRAEGFGYIPAYGLWFGKPVIATNYSGTTDFCTPETAFPAAYTHIPAKSGETILKVEDAFWADVSVSDVAIHMRSIADNPEAAHEKARRGQALVRTIYAPEALAKRYHDRLQTLGALD